MANATNSASTATAQSDRVQTVLNDAGIMTALTSLTTLVDNISGASEVVVGDAHTNDSDETTLQVASADGKVTIAADVLSAGSVIDVKALVNCTSTNSTDTLTLKLYAGDATAPGSSLLLCDTAAVDVADDDIGVLEATVVVRTGEATGTAFALSRWALDAPGTATYRPTSYLSSGAATEMTAIDFTSAIELFVTAEWSVAHANNSCRLELLTASFRNAN